MTVHLGCKVRCKPEKILILDRSRKKVLGSKKRERKSFLKYGFSIKCCYCHLSVYEFDVSVMHSAVSVYYAEV